MTSRRTGSLPGSRARCSIRFTRRASTTRTATASAISPASPRNSITSPNSASTRCGSTRVSSRRSRMPATTWPIIAELRRAMAPTSSSRRCSMRRTIAASAFVSIWWRAIRRISIRGSCSRNAREPNEFTHRYVWTNNPWVKRDGELDFISGNSDRAGAYAVNFFAHQPALNYGFGNPERSYQQDVDGPGPRATRAALKEIMKFWLDLGVDGFRVDLAASLVKSDPERIGIRRLVARNPHVARRSLSRPRADLRVGQPGTRDRRRLPRRLHATRRRRRIRRVAARPRVVSRNGAQRRTSTAAAAATSGVSGRRSTSRKSALRGVA